MQRKSIIDFLVGATITLLIVLLTFVVRCASVQEPQLQDTTLEEFLTHASTGDIVAIASQSKFSIRNNVMRAMSSASWTHVALVYEEDDGDKYIVEAYNYGPSANKEFFSHGSQVIPLREWVTHHQSRGYIVAWSRLYKDNAQTAPFHLDHRLIGKPVNLNVMHIYLSRWRQTHHTTSFKQEKVYCTELVVKLLQDFDIVDSNCTTQTFYPNEILFGSLPLINKYRYSTPSVLVV
jgi:hypothetical protein